VCRQTKILNQDSQRTKALPQKSLLIGSFPVAGRVGNMLSVHHHYTLRSCDEFDTTGSTGTEKCTGVIRTYNNRDSSYPLPRLLGHIGVGLERLAIRKRDRDDSVRYEKPGRSELELGFIRKVVAPLHHGTNHPSKRYCRTRSCFFV
jgi:hypothetical protein